ncbi:MAG: 2Fe-2S iron-sulfur cluster binding domain-containing protein [Firmicutes bacterium]|nr:2Fe-2S iron-sulfur cluster binding domain-containing protein [Bacillota bacterium]
MARITIVPDNVAVAARAGETVLEALRRHGYTMFFGCRRGGCGVCQVKLLDGAVHHGPYAPQALPQEAQDAGMVLACRAVADSDVTVEMVPSNRLRRLTSLWATAQTSSESG